MLFNSLKLGKGKRGGGGFRKPFKQDFISWKISVFTTLHDYLPTSRIHALDPSRSIVHHTFSRTSFVSLPEEFSLIDQRISQPSYHCDAMPSNLPLTEPSDKSFFFHRSYRIIYICPSRCESNRRTVGETRTDRGSIRSPNVVPLLVLLAHHADLQPVAAYGQIAAGNGHLFLAQVPVKVQVDLVLVHRAVQLRVEDHGRRADVVLARVVVVALVIRVVVVRGDRDRGCRPRVGPRAVVVARAPPAPRPSAPRENVRLARFRGNQRQRGRRASVARRIHRHAVRRVRVLLAVRRQNCNIPNIPFLQRSRRVIDRQLSNKQRSFRRRFERRTSLRMEISPSLPSPLISWQWYRSDGEKGFHENSPPGIQIHALRSVITNKDRNEFPSRSRMEIFPPRLPVGNGTGSVVG